MNLRERQRPLKERYREEPNAALITLRATGSQKDAPISCSVEIGRAIHEAQAHSGTGGAGTGACSGDMLLGALAACAQITCQMVASAMGIETNDLAVEVEGDLDLRGTLGVDKTVPVGFQDIRLALRVDAPNATDEQLAALEEKTHQYCVVLQTLQNPPRIVLSRKKAPEAT
ncbi:MAG: hypothetical protein QOH26_2185 [Actinomycetota bacterium]|nr:hypothetical protein [Actinomycetota bacterium]